MLSLFTVSTVAITCNIDYSCRNNLQDQTVVYYYIKCSTSNIQTQLFLKYAVTILPEVDSLR